MVVYFDKVKETVHAEEWHHCASSDAWGVQERDLLVGRLGKDLSATLLF